MKISLYRWAKNNDISYSTATKYRVAGLLDELHDDTPVPPRETVGCKICGKQIAQITASHLKSHDITLAQYKIDYPDASIVTEEVSQKISTALSGIVKNAEWCRKISESKTGVTPKNHPRFVIGAYHASEETKQKMAASQTGRTHLQETKDKIGAKHKGKKISQDAINKARPKIIAWNNEHILGKPGRKFTEEQKKRQSEIAFKREASYSAERRIEIGKARGDGVRGIKRTPEQKITYRKARVKFMSENPSSMKDTAGELSIKTWLENHNIDYVQQFVITDHYHPYDFFLPDYNTIIEFDGAHHWARAWFNISGKTDESRRQMLEDQIEKDAVENLEAGEAGYMIIRIRGYANVGDSPYGSLEEQLLEQGFLSSDHLIDFE